MNPLLYGHSPKEHVVAVHQLNDRYIRLYSRSEGKIQHEDVEFFPFFFLSTPSLLNGFPKQFWLKELAGDLHFNHIAAFSRWGDMWEAVHFALNHYNKGAAAKVSHYNELDALLFRPDPIGQYLTQSGNTLFKGMEFDELYRLQIDVQRAQRPAVPDTKIAATRIDRIVVSGSDGWYEVIEGGSDNPVKMLEAFVTLVRQKDPDVLEGHALYDTILPLLTSLAEQHSIDLSIGRDGASLKHVSPRQLTRTSESESGFYEVPGRHLIDTQRLAVMLDRSTRTFDNLTLEYLARYYGIDTEPVTPASASESFTPTARSRKADESLIQTVKLVRRLSEVLSPSNFFLAQMCPMNFDTLMRTGSAAKIEAILTREYLRQKHSLPQPERGSPSRGGYSDIFFTGVFPNILHADVESLYPSIIISQNIRPRSDRLGIFVPVLSELTSMRLDAKRQRQQAPTRQLRSRADALQSALKVLINSFYGYLAYVRARFNDYEQADRITSIGQTYLRTILEHAHESGAQVLEVDTDGLFFIPPNRVEDENQETVFVQQLSDALPEGINLLLAGRYKKMLSYRRKNYALLDHSDKVLIRGSSLIARSLELFARRYIEKCIECLFSGDIDGLHRTYTALHRRIVAHQWSVREFCRTETIREDLDAYEQLLKSGGRTPSPGMEAAKRASLYPSQGLVVYFYVTGVEANVKISDNCRVADEWDANLPDENTAYYLSRLDECSSKFKDFFAPADFAKVFSTDDLFGFSPEGIRVVNRELQPTRAGTATEEKEEDFPIWLDDLPT